MTRPTRPHHIPPCPTTWGLLPVNGTQIVVSSCVCVQILGSVGCGATMCHKLSMQGALPMQVVLVVLAHHNSTSLLAWWLEPWKGGSLVGQVDSQLLFKCVCLKIVYPYTQWLMIIIPTKWLILGIYPIFRQTQMVRWNSEFRTMSNPFTATFSPSLRFHGKIVRVSTASLWKDTCTYHCTMATCVPRGSGGDGRCHHYRRQQKQSNHSLRWGTWSSREPHPHPHHPHTRHRRITWQITNKRTVFEHLYISLIFINWLTWYRHATFMYLIMFIPHSVAVVLAWPCTSHKSLLSLRFSGSEPTPSNAEKCTLGGNCEVVLRNGLPTPRTGLTWRSFWKAWNKDGTNMNKHEPL